MDIILLTYRSFIEKPDDINVHSKIISDRTGLHKHDFVEIAYIASGSGRHRVEDEEYPAHRGDLYLFNSGVPHDFIADPGSTLLIYNCIFLPAALHDELMGGSDFLSVAYEYLFHSLISPEKTVKYIRLQDSASELATVLEEMQREYLGKKDGYRNMMKADLRRLLILIFRAYRNDGSQIQDPGVYRRLIVSSVLSYMREHSGEEIRCDDLAEHAYVSSGYLARIFKAETGKTMNVFLREIRMEQAKELLLSTNDTVREIAARVGYSDLKFFYEIFRKSTGVTPGEWRERAKEKA
ncbi:MAG: helix-turn-helix domain-containing protein [Eubacteriales bacterium]